QYTIDYAAGIVRFPSGLVGQAAGAQPGTPTFISTSLPFIVKVANAPEQIIYGTQTDVGMEGNAGTGIPRYPTETRIVGPKGMDNLLWYATIPVDVFTFNGNSQAALGFISSSPSIQGDNIWFGFQSGYVGSMPADPAKRNPSFQGNGAQVFIDGSTTNTLP